MLHRALFTWFICLMFLILLVLRLDERVRWSWFIVFIPLWLYDSILLIYLIFSMVSHCRTSHDRFGKNKLISQNFFRFQRSILRKLWYIFLVVLQLAAQIMLCLKLSEVVSLSLFYVMIPVWIILSASTVDVFQSLFEN